MIFKIENKYISREIIFENSVSQKSVVTDKISGCKFENDGKEDLIAIPGLDLSEFDVSFKENSIIFKSPFHTLIWEFKVFDTLPFIESRIGIKGIPINTNYQNDSLGEGVESAKNIVNYKDYSDGLGCPYKHITLEKIEFFDRTDYTNHLVSKERLPLYYTGYNKLNGHIFVLCDNASEQECVIIKNAPCSEAHINKQTEDFISAGASNIHISASGIDMGKINENDYTYSYPVAIGVCKSSARTEFIKNYYTECSFKKNRYIMSNTWGDCNGDSRVCEEFVIGEIKHAAQIGIDIVQIDDGWQKGITANSRLKKGGQWGSYRSAEPDFWEINQEKFPNGLENICKAANNLGVEVGLWFSPDSMNDYSSWELDAQTMLDLYKKYGIRYFKLDGITVSNKECERNIVKMLKTVKAVSGDEITFNMDITNGKRFGFFVEREYGDLFVENRYTDVPNYYPHDTLRNLWKLSNYFPAQRMQFEVLNNKRNAEKYDGNDILAPNNYSIDYIFASVMAAKPLMWTELSSLSEEDAQHLKSIISVYKKYRDDFVSVSPIFDEPNGFSLTGFYIAGQKNNYVILIREFCENDTFENVTVKEVLYTNDCDAELAPARLTKKAAYLFGIV